MKDRFPIPPDFFSTSAFTRTLGAGTTWGFVILNSVDHGTHPSHGWHRQPHFALNYLLRGSGSFTDSNGRVHRLNPGSLYHHFPGTKARLILDPAARCAEFYLLCDATTYEGLRQLQIIPPDELLSTRINDLVLDAYGRFRSLCARPPQEASRRLILAGLIDFLSLLYELAHHNQPASPWHDVIRLSAQHLEENLEKRLNLPDLARHYGVSYSTFRREFKKMMRVAPAEYRIRQRIEAACRLLPRFTVKEVAEQLGYCDAFTFSSQFKIFTGIPPSRFREKLPPAGG